MIAPGNKLRLPMLDRLAAPEPDEPDAPARATIAADDCADVHASIARSDWPDEAGVARLVAAGVFALSIATPLRLGFAQARETLRFLRFNRECLSFGVRLDWTGTIDATLDTRVLSHLIPPRSDGDARQAAWARDHSYGRCYWRSGPGFVLIKDRRAGREAARFVLDAPEAVALFRSLANPRRADELTSTASELGPLVDEGLVLSLDGELLALPMRMRRWPVPALAL